jgi:hypothetical protein
LELPIEIFKSADFSISTLIIVKKKQIKQKYKKQNQRKIKKKMAMEQFLLFLILINVCIFGQINKSPKSQFN